MSEETRQELAEKISNVLNGTGAYNQIVEIIESETGLSIDCDSYAFNEIEETFLRLLTDSTEQ